MSKTLFIFYLIGFYSRTATHLGSYGDFQHLLVEEDPTRTNIGLFARMGRTNDAPHESWKTSQHESFRPATAS